MRSNLGIDVVFCKACSVGPQILHTAADDMHGSPDAFTLPISPKTGALDQDLGRGETGEFPNWDRCASRRI
ncbi:uncharacterized protein BDV17DRAFT_258703 [Aspergillus undulatus]|uniref:uncharacterized protein n=1 Tax=Aspergillus undulatus TaxID=1810928 RepID=UPI003CCE4F44